MRHVWIQIYFFSISADFYRYISGQFSSQKKTRIHDYSNNLIQNENTVRSACTFRSCKCKQIAAHIYTHTHKFLFSIRLPMIFFSLSSIPIYSACTFWILCSAGTQNWRKKTHNTRQPNQQQQQQQKIIVFFSTIFVLSFSLHTPENTLNAEKCFLHRF